MDVTPTSAGNRHGSGAIRSGRAAGRDATSLPPKAVYYRTSNQRARSRDRSNRASVQMEAEARFRAQPAGPQEEQDWIAALEGVKKGWTR